MPRASTATRTQSEMASRVKSAVAPRVPFLLKNLPTVDQWFGIDWRALVLFRVLLGVNVVFDLLTRLQNLTEHYTDFGVLPRAAYYRHYYNAVQICFHAWFGSSLAEGLLFLVAGVIAVSLVVGYRTWLCTFLSYAFLLSLEHRNPLVLNSGDVILRLLFFWALFLPLGRHGSIDAWRKGRDSKPVMPRYFSMATLALVLQVCFVYIFAALHKSGAEWHSLGSAIHYALYVDSLATPFAYWFRQFDGLLTFMTPIVWHFEMLGPFFLFSPFLFAPLRTAVTFAFIGMHTGFLLCMGNGVFPLICFTALLVLPPTEAWDWLEKALTHSRLYPRWSAFREWLKAKTFRPEKKRSRPAPQLLLSVREGVATYLIFYIVIWNLAGLNQGVGIVNGTAWIANVFRIDQRWDMFSPFPLKDDGWWVAPGELSDGKMVDVLNDKATPVSWEKPALVSATFTNARDQKYLMNLWAASNKQYRPYYAEYLCRRWNANHPGQRLKSLDLYFMKELTLDVGKAKPEKISLWKQYCL